MKDKFIYVCMLGVPLGLVFSYIHYWITSHFFGSDIRYGESNGRLTFTFFSTIVVLFIFYVSETDLPHKSFSYFTKVVVVSILVFLWYWSFRARLTYCANCGYYYGTSPQSTCPRCGHNIWTYRFRGVGDTYREGPKNY